MTRMTASPSPNKRRSAATAIAKRKKRPAVNAKPKPARPAPKAASDVARRHALKRAAVKLRKALDELDQLLEA